MTQADRTERLQAEIVEQLPALRAFARRFHRAPGDADDLVQETVLKALANLDRFEEGSRLKSWLFTIMRNTFCSRFAILRREAPGLAECVADRRSTDASQEWSLLAQDVEHACDRLPRHYRLVLESIVLQGHSYEQVAEELGCAVGTIKSRLNRARSQIISQFGSLNE